MTTYLRLEIDIDLKSSEHFLTQVKRQALLELYWRCGCNITQAAATIGCTVSYLSTRYSYHKLWPVMKKMRRDNVQQQKAQIKQA
jgi:hypothetical protein